MVPTGPGGAPASGPGLGGRGAREEIKLRGIRGGKRSGVEGDNGGRGKVGEYLWCGGVGGGGGGDRFMEAEEGGGFRWCVEQTRQLT